MKGGEGQKSKSSEAPGPVGWMSRSDPSFASHIRKVIASDGFATEGESLERHQHVVKRFLVGSPYRGLLVFHGLGSGKTCAAISAMEALMQDFPRVFVVLPASLQNNFVEEMAKCARDVPFDSENPLFEYGFGLTY